MFAVWHLRQSGPVADVGLCPPAKLAPIADQSANRFRRAVPVIDRDPGAPAAPMRDATTPGTVDATARKHERNPITDRSYEAINQHPPLAHIEHPVAPRGRSQRPVDHRRQAADGRALMLPSIPRLHAPHGQLAGNLGDPADGRAQQQTAVRTRTAVRLGRASRHVHDILASNTYVLWHQKLSFAAYYNRL